MPANGLPQRLPCFHSTNHRQGCHVLMHWLVLNIIRLNAAHLLGDEGSHCSLGLAWLHGPGCPLGLAIAAPLLGYVTGSQACPVSSIQFLEAAQPLPPEGLRISPMWVESLSKKWPQALLQPEAEGACLVASRENILPSA